MSSTAKKTVKKALAPDVVAPAPVTTPAVEVSASVAKKASKKEVVVAAVVEAPTSVVAASEPAPVASASEVTESSWNEDLTGLTKHLSAMRDTISMLFTEVKRLEKKVARTVKDAGKRRKNRKTEVSTDAPKRPTAFEIPQQVSDDLNDFLGNPKGTLISRADVTRRVTAYAKEHKLMNKHDINADEALLKLLNPSGNLEEGKSLTIFNLQTCLRNHYPKKAVAVTVSATA